MLSRHPSLKILTSLMRIFYVKDRSSVGRESLTVVKQVFPAWDIVGWYAVKEMPRNAIDIQQQLAAFQSDPVAILLHASADALSRAQKTGALPIECYVTRDTQLYSVPTSLSTSSAEHVVLKDANEYMQKTHAFQGDNSATLAAFMAERDAVQTLHERICEIKCYVDQVKAGTRPHNDEILRRIAAAVANQGYQKAPEYKDTIYEGPNSYLADLTNNLHTLHEVRATLTQLVELNSLRARRAGQHVGPRESL